MTIEEIDRKILEFNNKLKNAYTFTTTKKGKRRKIHSIPHLHKYYVEEIVKLEKIKEKLHRHEEYTLTLNWDSVFFEDSFIKVLVNNRYTERHFTPESHCFFNYLMPYIIKLGLQPITIKIANNKIVHIENIGEINNILRILSVKDEIKKYFENYEAANIGGIISKLGPITNNELSRFFKLNHRNNFLLYLSKVQNIDYKIIPTFELKTLYNRVISEEETFLFTLKSLTNVYIIWESSLSNKATYVFETTEDDYLKAVQHIFDYIASEQSCKRRRLRYSIGLIENPLKCISYIQHNSFDSWKKKLELIVVIANLESLNFDN